MTVYFYNEEAIDLGAVEVMGVSVKIGEKPIGFFGTGLKYAICTLLRLGCKVQLIRNGTRITFYTQPEIIRGEEFQRVYMDGKPMGFTTQLGRQWEAWQAYRELHCNTTDEGGGVSKTKPDVNKYGTIFYVTGEAIDKAYAERNRTILEGDVQARTSSVEIYPGSSMFAYYRNIRVGAIQQPSIYTYNVTSVLKLTEDRTLEAPYYWKSVIESAIPHLKDKEMLKRILLAPKGSFEQELSLTQYMTPSSEFMEVCRANLDNLRLNYSALKLYERHEDVKVRFRQEKLNPEDEKLLDEAFKVLRALRCGVQRDELNFTSKLDSNTLGLYRDGEIMINMNCFDKGYIMLAGTIYEEYIHKTLNLDDESRAMQNFLIDKLMTLANRLVEG